MLLRKEFLLSLKVRFHHLVIDPWCLNFITGHQETPDDPEAVTGDKQMGAVFTMGAKDFTNKHNDMSALYSTPTLKPSKNSKTED